MKEINGVKEIDMNKYQKLVAKASAAPKMSNDELIGKLQKGINDIYKVMNFIPTENDRDYVYRCLEGIHEIINDLVVDGDVQRTEYIVDEE